MAVFTPLSQGDIEGLLPNFGIGSLLAHEAIAEGVENTNYKITAAAGRFILTVVEKRTQEEDLPFIIGFMRGLAREGIPVPRIVDGLHGSAIGRIAGKPVLLTGFLDGAAVTQASPRQVKAAGQMLGRMHLAGLQERNTRKNPMCPAQWQKLFGESAKKNHPLATEMLAHIGALSGFWTRNLPRGAVHADYFMDNVFFNGDDVCGVIDFYFSCTDMLAYDLMLAVNAWCFSDGGAPLPGRARDFLQGYESVRQLTPQERDGLPALGRAAAARIIATRLYDLLHHDVSNLVTPKDPAPYKKIFDFHSAADILTA